MTLKIVSIFLFYEDVYLSQQIQDFDLGTVCFSLLYIHFIFISLDSLTISSGFLPMKVWNGNQKDFRDDLVFLILPVRKLRARATG